MGWMGSKTSLPSRGWAPPHPPGRHRRKQKKLGVPEATTTVGDILPMVKGIAGTRKILKEIEALKARLDAGGL